MKKTKLMAVIAAGICAISLAVGIVVSNKTVDSVIRENAEVLANGEGGRCRFKYKILGNCKRKKC